MWMYFLSNLSMGASPVQLAVSYYLVDPDAGSLIVTADDPATYEIDPDAGSLIIV